MKLGYNGKGPWPVRIRIICLGNENGLVVTCKILYIFLPVLPVDHSSCQLYIISSFKIFNINFLGNLNSFVLSNVVAPLAKISAFSLPSTPAWSFTQCIFMYFFPCIGDRISLDVLFLVIGFLVLWMAAALSDQML